MQSEDIEELATALVAAQKGIKNAVRSEDNPFFHSKYADLAAIYDACRDAMTTNNLTVVQYGGFEADQPVLYTELIHKTGQYIRGFMPVFVPVQPETPEETEFDGKGEEKAKKVKQVNKSQGYGSSMTYMRRYALAAMLGVATEDDDANSSSENKSAAKSDVPKKTTSTDPATEAQKGKIVAQAHELGWKSTEVAKYLTEKKVLWNDINKTEASTMIEDLIILIGKKPKEGAE
jgi:hypothetical protein